MPPASAGAQQRRSDPEDLRLPLEAELGWRRHEAEKRGSRDDRGAREGAFPAVSHAILPVPVERRDRALPGGERVRPLPEARPTPRLADLAADRSEHFRDRFAA